MRRFATANELGDGRFGHIPEEVPEITQGHRSERPMVLKVANHPDELETVEEELRITGSRSPPAYPGEQSLLNVICDGTAIEARLLLDLIDGVAALLDHPSTVTKGPKNCQELSILGRSVNIVLIDVNDWHQLKNDPEF
jgi:hypothetical protein